MDRRALIVGLVLACLATPRLALASFVPLELFDLAGSSDVIIRGEIVEVRDATFLVKIDDTLVGEHREKLEIEQFNDWVCARRWAPYKVGQEVLVFANEHEGKLHLRGAGGEGESPVDGEDVYCHFVCPFEPTEKVGSTEMAKVPYKDLKSAILGYRDCFRLIKAKKHWRSVGEYNEYFAFDKIERISTNEELSSFVKTSKVHAFLVESTSKEIRRIELHGQP